jgi:hypothetical protein
MPEAQAIWLFGSFEGPQARPDSDVPAHGETIADLNAEECERPLVLRHR